MAEDTFIRLVFFLNGIFFSILLDLIVEPIRIRWRMQANFDCKKCKVWDCPAKKCIKKSKYFIISIILISFFITNVSASTVDIQLSSFTYDNRNMLDMKWYGIGHGNSTLAFDFDFVKTDANAQYLYTSIVLCSDSTYSSSYASDPSEITNIQINNTNYSCTYNNSGYTGGKVVIINFLAYSSGANSIVIYQNDDASIQLIDFAVDSSSYVNPMNYSSQTAINQNSNIINQNTQIINQNDTIINNQNGIKDNTDKIKDTISSDDGDTTSSKCGIICKLKGIFTGIANLPSKIGDLLKSLFIPSDEQMSDLLNDTQTKLNNKLGILALPTTLYTQFLNLLTSDVNENTCIQFDNIKDPVYDQLLIGSSSFCFNTLLQNEKLNTFRTSCLLIVGGLLLLAFVSFLKKQYNRILDINDPDENYEYITSEDSYNIDYSTGEVTGMKHNERKTRRNKL